MSRKAQPADPPCFTESLFRFLRELAVHNEREWFQANKARFESDVREPLQAFILAAAEPLRRINPNYASGSMFRIFRDTRFSRDKSPYKTNVGIHFRHRDCPRDVHSPGFYLHLEPGECFVSTGLWHPDPEALRKVREHIVDRAEAWRGLKRKGIQVLGDALVRVPKGFPADHPCAEDLKLKDFYTHTPLSEREVCGADFLERFAEACRQGAPLAAFLTEALGLPWRGREPVP